MRHVSKSKKCGCGGEMRQTQVTKTVPIAGRRIKVENVKGFICDQCGEVYLDGPSLLEIETTLLRQSSLAKT